MLLYPDAKGWYCIDDPAPDTSKPGYSYCWSEREECERIYVAMVERRSTVKPCRSHARAYCYNKHSSLMQNRRYACAATLEQCEAHREDWTEKELPKEGYEFSPCTEQP